MHRRIVAVTEFDAFLSRRQPAGPWLAESPGQIRALMLDFLGHLRVREPARGRRAGQRLSPASVQRLASDVEQFYLFMTDNKEAAAAALAEPGLAAAWPPARPVLPARRASRQAPPRARARGHRRRRHDPDHGRDRPARRPASQGGLGDEQAMRITMLVALLGRRISEICLLDRDPLLPLLPAPAGSTAAADGQAPVARLRYQQTKIDGAPDTVLVDAGVVAIIREQQEWADRFFAGRGAPGKTPKYLFLAGQMNRNGDRPYSGGTLHDPAQRTRPPPRRAGRRRRPGRLQPHPPVPAHGRDKLAELRRADPRAAAVYGASDPGDDHALRADPAVHRRG